MLICEMAAYYRKQGKNLLQVLEELYAEYGVFRHSLLNAEFEGASGMAAMQRLMASLREKRPASIAGDVYKRQADDGKGGDRFHPRGSGTYPG